MYKEIMTAWEKNPIYEYDGVPPPVEESATIVRIPSYSDARSLWQGATIIAVRAPTRDLAGRYIVRFDDGRVMYETSPVAALELFQMYGDIWM